MRRVEGMFCGSIQGAVGEHNLSLLCTFSGNEACEGKGTGNGRVDSDSYRSMPCSVINIIHMYLHEGAEVPIYMCVCVFFLYFVATVSPS